MVDRIIEWSLKNRFIVLVAAAVLLVWGALEAARMPVDVFPDLTAPTVTVLTEAHGMAPEEIETLLTFPIETALNGSSGVRRVRSSTSVGISVVWVEFEWGTDIYRARQVVSEKLQAVRGSLPPDIEPPVLAPISSIMGEVMFIALTSETHSPMELRSAADWVLRRRLLAVAGVSQVTPIGGDERQYQVLLDPVRLTAFGLTTHDVTRALSATNANTSAGFVINGGQEYLVRGLGRVRTVEEIAQTVVELRADVPIVIADVATVAIGSALKRGDGSFKGEPAVILGIQKQPGVNTLELTASLDEVLDDVQASLPQGMTIHKHIFRQASFIRVAIENVMAALRDGALLVILIVFVFVLSGRATLITVLAIPLSLVSAVLVLRGFGATINTMTLGGMAIAVGALVDDAIIDVENVVRRLKLNSLVAPADRRTPMAVVFDASREIRASIVFATVIIVVAFLPLFFLSGVEGRLLAPLGLAYVVSLAASLIVALTVTPALCFLLLPGSKAVTGGHEPATVRWLKKRYLPILGFVLHRWKAVAGLGAAGFVVAAGFLSVAGQSFLPEFNEGALTIGSVTMPGISLEESDRLGDMVEKILLDQPEVVVTARRTGRAELDEHALGVNSSEIDIGLQMGERSKEELLAVLRDGFARIPGMNVTIGQPISHRIDHMLSGTRANVAVKIFGKDLFELRRLAVAVRDVMQDVEGVVDLSVEQQANIPVITARFDRVALARHGLRTADVGETLEIALRGVAVSKVLDADAAYDLVVRFAGSTAQDVEAVGNTLIPTPSGGRVPLHALADVKRDRGPNTISRENVQRKIVVMCNVAGRDLRGTVDEIRKKVAASVARPDGYHIEYGGQFESAASASRVLLLLGMLAIVGIFLLLFVAFRSGRDALLVMVNLPLALIGGVIGVFASGGIISVASIIGFITVFGIATRNGIMMVTHFRHLREKEGVEDIDEVVKRGAAERVAPILMTALAAGLALVPLALSGGQPGAEIETPMAIVILFGLLSSTALNMLVVPPLYRRFGELARRHAVGRAEPL